MSAISSVSLGLGLLSCLHAVEDIPAGHLQPLGFHRPPDGSVEKMDVLPSAKEFYDRYVSKSKPVVFRGAAKRTRAFQMWNDAYLSNTFGELKIDVEEGKKEDRSKGMNEMTMAQFLSRYRTSDIYMVGTVPQQMRHEVELLPVIACGGYTERLTDAVMWFSSGGTNSVLHFDAVDNINCLLDGTKDVILINRKHKDLVDIDHAEGSYCGVDVESVDMAKYPGLGKVPWDVVHIQPGDCLFIPFRWFHQVKSGGDRNLAINIWWSKLTDFNDTDCLLQDKDDYTALSNYELLNMTSWSLLTGGKAMTRDVLKSRFLDLGYEMSQLKLEELLDELDTNQDNVINAEEFQSNFPYHDEL